MYSTKASKYVKYLLDYYESLQTTILAVIKDALHMYVDKENCRSLQLRPQSADDQGIHLVSFFKLFLAIISSGRKAQKSVGTHTTQQT
jgi:hypothetical protein